MDQGMEQRRQSCKTEKLGTVMKYLIFMVFACGVVAGSAYYLKQTKGRVASLAAPASSDNGSAAEPCIARDVAHSATASDESIKPLATAEVSPSPGPLDKAAIGQSVEVLVSNQASYQQKRAIWQQLRDHGCLDQAIAGLEQLRTNNPSSPEYAAVLGHAYLQKCAIISDMREQGILAMQADKLFDAALRLDPSNWEARFTKAVALSYWPASMGKSEEVIEHFTTLIEQQEVQPSQPQFGESYLWLGEQYEKAGRTEDARAVWQRGAALFPDFQQLKNKLTSASAHKG